MSDQPSHPSDHVPGILASDEIAPYQLAYMEREKKRMLDELAAKIAKLKSDYAKRKKKRLKR